MTPTELEMRVRYLERVSASVRRQQKTDNEDIEKLTLRRPIGPSSLTVIAPCGGQECLFPSRNLTITKTVDYAQHVSSGPVTFANTGFVNQNTVSRVATYRDARLRVNNTPELYGPYWYTDAFQVDRFDDVVFPTATGGPGVRSLGDLIPFTRWLKLAFVCMGRGTMTLLVMAGRTADEANAWHFLGGGSQPDTIYSILPYGGTFLGAFAGPIATQPSFLAADGFSFSDPYSNPRTVFADRRCSPLRTYTGALQQYFTIEGGGTRQTIFSFLWTVEDI